jgi:hypothetical protein
MMSPLLVKALIRFSQEGTPEWNNSRLTNSLPG